MAGELVAASDLLDAAHALLAGPLVAPWPRKHDELAALEAARTRLKSRFVLAVVGEFSSGKSFLLNALLGTVNRTGETIGGLLAVDINPSTATITELGYGAEKRATAYFPSGREERIPIEGLGRFVAVAKDGPGALHGAFDDDDGGPSRVAVEVDSPFLGRGFLLADTPGLASLNPAHRRATLGYLPRADAVLYLIDTQQPFTEGDASFLGLIAQYVRVIFIVQTKIDLRRALRSDGRQEWEVGRKRIADRAAVNVAGAEIVAVSAREYAQGLLDGDEGLREQSRVPELMAHIERSLDDRVGRARAARARELVRFLAAQTLTRTREEAELLELDESSLRRRREEANEILEARDLALAGELEALHADAAHADRFCREQAAELRAGTLRAIARAFDVSDISRLRDRAKLHMLVDGVAGEIFGAFAAGIAAEIADDLERLAHERPDLGVAEAAARAFGGEPGSGVWSRDLASGIRATIVLGGLGGPVLPFVHAIGQAFASRRDGEYMKRELTVDLRERLLPELSDRIDDFVDGLRTQTASMYASVDDALRHGRTLLRAETLEPIDRALEQAGRPMQAERARVQSALRAIESLLEAADEPEESEHGTSAGTAPAHEPPPPFDADAYLGGLRPQRYRVVVLGALDRGKSTLINAIAGTQLLAGGAEIEERFPIHVRYGAEGRAYALLSEGRWHEIPMDAAMVAASRSPVLIETPWQMPRELVLVHAPAFDSGDSEAEAIALAAAANASEIVMLFSRQISDREVNVLERVAAPNRPVLLVHTMADTESAAERRTVVELAHKALGERRIDVERVFTVSGHDALEAAAGSRPLAPWNELYALRDTLAAHADEHMTRLARRDRQRQDLAAKSRSEQDSSTGLGGTLARLLGRRTRS